MDSSPEPCPVNAPPWTLRARKRVFDVVLATGGLMMTLPLFLAIAVAIKSDSRGPVLFLQERVGKNGRTFKILKFRTMRVAAESMGPNYTVSGDSRITRVGAWLRAAKLDELPQLVNVLVGEMSLVGPRPETPDLMQYYKPAQRAEFALIRPGITDYASILLRDEGALLGSVADPARYYREELMPMKHALCRRYLREIGVVADIKIIAMTLASLFSGRFRSSPIEVGRGEAPHAGPN